MKSRTAFLPLILLATIVVLAYLTLSLVAQSPVPDPHPSGEVISIASAPLAVKGLVALIVVIFGVTSLATLL